MTSSYGVFGAIAPGPAGGGVVVGGGVGGFGGVVPPPLGGGVIGGAPVQVDPHAWPHAGRKPEVRALHSPRYSPCLVRPYQTLWTIAQAHYGGDVRDAIYRIEQANHLSGATITPGQRLLLP